jgi:hypothetical protein
LSHDDVLIICSGTNDLAVNKSTSALRNISNFVTRNEHTNIILVNVPYRYDTRKSNIVNESIGRLNKKLNKLVTISPCARFLGSDQDRKLFMNHGLHHNRLGKQLFFHQIAIMLYSLFEQRNTDPISLSWHNEDHTDISITLKNSEPNALKYQEHRSILNNNNQNNSSSVVTTCNKGLPVTRSADFLW